MQSSPLIDALATYFFLQEDTFSRQEILQVFTGLTAGYQDIATPGTDPGNTAVAKLYVALPGTYNFFLKSDGTPMVVDQQQGAKTVLFAFLTVIAGVTTKVEIAVDLTAVFSGSVNRLTVVNAGDADYTLAAAALLKLPAVTADRLLTLPPPSLTTGIPFPVANNNNNPAYKWSFAGNVLNSSGAVFNDMANNTTYQLVSDGTHYLLIQAQYVASGSQVFPVSFPITLS